MRIGANGGIDDARGDVLSSPDENKEVKSGGHAGHERGASVSLGALFLTFLKIGLTAFGGFMALISVVQNYAVERKKLLKNEEMLDGISLATILPGPVAVNVVAYVGYRTRGVMGAAVSAGAVILPAFLLILALSYAYFRFGQLPVVGKFFQGFIPAVSAIILAAAWNMATKAIKGVSEAVLAVAAAGLLLGVGGFFVTIAIVVLSGLAGWMLYYQPRKRAHAKMTDQENVKSRDAAPKPWMNMAVSAPLSGASLLGLHSAAAKLLIVFGGMSVLLFGGGYVFIPLMQRIVVDGYGWVTRQEFIDAIALGQVTPGPILISAAFIGYKVAGFTGATAATIAIFTPPAVIMLLAARLLDRIKASESIKASLRGIRPAVIGMIAAAAVTVARSAPQNWISLLIFGASLVALFRFKLETAWIIPAAGIAGLVLF
ncbi:MAG TPA: chromate efflux transporter [Nitrospirota bacterium]